MIVRAWISDQGRGRKDSPRSEKVISARKSQLEGDVFVGDFGATGAG
jgi:hypothetical protein